MFYTVPSRLIGQRLRVRLHDDRLELFMGGTHLMTLARGRPPGNGKNGHVIDYLAENRLPDMAKLRARFAPDPASLPEVTVTLVPLSAYDTLLTGAAA